MSAPRYVSDAERETLIGSGEPGQYLLLLVVGAHGAIVDGTKLVPRMADTIAALLEDGNTLRCAIQDIVKHWQTGELAEAVNAARVCMTESEMLAAKIRGGK